MAESINPRRTDLRLPPENIPKEILPLVQAVTKALDRLEAGFRIQPEFTAAAQHQLLTPLSILRSRIDSPTACDICKVLNRDIYGMARIVSQLLDIAELETLSLDPLEKADLRAICAEVAEFAAPLALAKDKEIALSGCDGSVWISGDPEMLSRAIRNLVENAINYSPPGTTVEIVVESSGVVRVPDERPGIDGGAAELHMKDF